MSRLRLSSRYEEIKLSIAELVEDYDISYPVDLMQVAENLGVRVDVGIWGFEPPELGCISGDGFVETTDTPFGHQFRISLNGLVQTVRQRFTLAHEIGHIWLEHPFRWQSLGAEATEGEANFFASYLLAPDILVASCVKSLAVDEIAEVFGLSNTAAVQVQRRVFRAINHDDLRSDYSRKILERVGASFVHPQIASRGGL